MIRCFIVLLLLLSENIFCIDFSAADLHRRIELTDSKIIFEEIEYTSNDSSDYITHKEEYELTWEIQNTISYIQFDYTGKLLENETNGVKKYLILYDVTENFMFLTLYNAQNKLVYEIFGWKYTLDAGRSGFPKANSELRERDIVYKAENLVDVDNLVPWVEGVNGSGIGQKITLLLLGNSNPCWFGLLVSNGFVDYNRPYLFADNNRVKKIRVHYGNLGKYTDFDLLDISNYQYLEFPYGYEDYWGEIEFSFITIEILEVYKGNRWDDTCINLIYTIAD